MPFLAGPPEKKPIFSTVLEARLALSSDGLGVVYRSAKTVYVMTAFGSGTFTVKEWDESE